MRLVRSPETAENGAVFLGALLTGKELPVLKPLKFERFRVSFPENGPPFWFHCCTRERQNELRGLQFGAEAKDSGAVKIILNSCECNPANVPRVDN